jgi:hypothetical protein
MNFGQGRGGIDPPWPHAPAKMGHITALGPEGVALANVARHQANCRTKRLRRAKPSVRSSAEAA